MFYLSNTMNVKEMNTLSKAIQIDSVFLRLKFKYNILQ